MIKSQSLAISVVDLVKRYEDVTAVDGLSFDVEEGEIFGLLGPNGAGKSTTINILSGILEPTSGKALVLGFDVQKESTEIKERIGVCPQEPAFFPYLTGRENVELIGDLHCMEKKKLKERTDFLLDRVGLDEASSRRARAHTRTRARSRRATASWLSMSDHSRAHFSTCAHYLFIISKSFNIHEQGS